ncbi:hypothetical protein [uncultured Sneathiella sp.]|uniref:hypothetical protein n=1 Tax=uncultured Sneathiella sp. TaxID=879315 RepID=UPI0030EE7800|tara:strand:+ start:13589 stop:13954 length:366 start_codon:yes stop_codon:yes gene_type:complete
MAIAPHSLVGKSLEWTGVHHSLKGDFTDLTTHTVTYETETSCYVTANGVLVGEATYSYQRLDDEMGICIYRPTEYQGRDDVVLNAMFDFRNMKDRAVLTAGGEPFAVADGDMKEVETPPRP